MVTLPRQSSLGPQSGLVLLQALKPPQQAAPDNTSQHVPRHSPEHAESGGSAKPPRQKQPVRRRAVKSARSEKQWRRINTFFRVMLLFVLLPLFVLCLHALWLADSYQNAAVVDRHGLSTFHVGSAAGRLAIGDMVNGQGEPLLETGKDVDVVLSLADSTIRIGPESQLQIRQLGYAGGRSRRLELLRGQIEVDVQPTAGPPGQYSVNCRGASVETTGARFQIIAQAHGLQARVLNGKVLVAVGASKRALAAGQEISAQKGQALSRTVPLSAHARETIALNFPAATTPTPLVRIQEAYLHAQQQTLMPPASRLLWFAHHTL